MSQSKSIEELNTVLFELDIEEPINIGPIFERTQNSSYSLISSETIRLLAGKKVMTDDEFLDLIPVNGFFH